jgi:hypothetical protein
MNRERPIQRAVVAYLRQVLPDALVHHSVNEQALSGRDRKAAAIAMRNAKLDGMVPGFPDVIVLPWAHIPLMFFEVKAEGAYTTPTQREVHSRLETLGYRVAVVRSVDDVREALAAWGIGTREAVKIPLRGTIT